MTDSKDDERDEEWFKEIYGKEYTGPPRPSNDNARDNTNVKKRSGANAISSAGESDGEDEPRDPNAVPTDFTSREAKVWEAKAKAVERNWKRRKEEELICRICGETGHFPQGCPTTLGSNRKPGEIVERVPIKDKRLKPRIIGTGGITIQGIEKDTGCRLKLEDNLTVGDGAFFVRVSGTNRIMVLRAVETVKKLVDQVEGDWKQQNTRCPHDSYNGGSSINPLIAAQMQHIATQRMQHNNPNLQPYPGQADAPLDQDQHAVEHINSHLDARRQWETGPKNGSGTLSSYFQKGGHGSGNMPFSYSSKGSGSEGAGPYDHGQNQEGRENLGKGGVATTKEQEQEMALRFEQIPIPKTLEALEQRFVQETMELTKEQNEAEDKENARHRECLRGIQELYQEKMITLRAQQAKYREELLRHEAQVRQRQYRQQAGTNHYNYLGGAMPSYGVVRERLGYGSGPAEGHPGYVGSFPSYKGEGQHYNTGNPFNRNLGYDAGILHPGNQGFGSAPYPY